MAGGILLGVCTYVGVGLGFGVLFGSSVNDTLSGAVFWFGLAVAATINGIVWAKE